MNNLAKTVELLANLMLAESDEEKTRLKEKLQAAVDAQSRPELVPVETRVSNILTDLGMPCRLRGYEYTVTAVCALVHDRSLKCGIMKQLYPYVAKVHGTTTSCVERAIRTAVEIVWSRGNSHVFERLFQHTTDPRSGKTTNSEFLCRIAEEISRKRGTYEVD